MDIKSQQYDLQQGKADPKINAIVVYGVGEKGFKFLKVFDNRI